MDDDFKELVASYVTNKSIVEVVRIYHSQAGAIYISNNVIDGTTIIDENGIEQTVWFSNSALTEESTGRILLNERTLTLQGYNDIVADYENLITDRNEKIRVSILGYISDMSGVLSTIAAGPYKYYVRSVGYAQKNNSCQLSVSTSPTNNNETGYKMSLSKYETLRGFT